MIRVWDLGVLLGARETSLISVSVAMVFLVLCESEKRLNFVT